MFKIIESSHKQQGKGYLQNYMKTNNFVIELLDAFVTCNVLPGMNRTPLVLSMERNKKTATFKLKEDRLTR